MSADPFDQTTLSPITSYLKSLIIATPCWCSNSGVEPCASLLMLTGRSCTQYSGVATFSKQFLVNINPKTKIKKSCSLKHVYMAKWTPLGSRSRSSPLRLMSTDEMLGLIKASLSSSSLVEESLRSP